MDAVNILDSLVSGVGVAIVIAVWRYIHNHESRHEKTDDRLTRMEAEFYPNGGKSLWDRTEATYRLVEKLAREAGHAAPPQPKKEPME